MKFFIKCNPPRSTAQAGLKIMKNHRTGRQFVGKKQGSKAQQTQSELMWLLSQYVPKEPFEQPIHLSVLWAYPWRKGEPQKNRASGWKPCDTRPDCDNLCKMLLDCMTRLGYWTDDSIIFDLHFKKIYSDEPGIGIDIH